jgi:chromosome segregation ATPase
MAASIGVNDNELRSLLDVFRHVVETLNDFIGSLENLSEKYEQVQDRHVWLEGEYQALQQAHDHICQDHVDATRALSELRAAHEALVREHEASMQVLRELRDLLRDKAYAIEKLNDSSAPAKR